MSEQDSLSERVYRALKADIIHCNFAPGSIIAENDLAEKYDVSRTPVRESLGRLEQEGFVQSLPKRGYAVSPITLKDVQEVFSLRILLEGEATALATRRASEDVIRRLEEQNLLDDAGECIDHDDKPSAIQYIEENTKFHMTIAEASGNTRLARVIRNLLEEADRYIFIQTGIVGQRGIEESARVIDAIRAGDDELARAAMQEHVRGTYERAVQVILSGSEAFHLG